MKKNYTKFNCDSCCAEVMVESGTGYPYEKGWHYIYNLNGKTLDTYAPGIEIDVKKIEGKDLHFCSQACLLSWMKEKFRPWKEGDPIKKIDLEECKKLYERSVQTGIRPDYYKKVYDDLKKARYENNTISVPVGKEQSYGEYDDDCNTSICGIKFCPYCGQKLEAVK